MIIVRSHLCEGMVWQMTFTAKLVGQDAAAAVTFEASVYDGIEETEVEYVRVKDPPALQPLTY